MSHAARQRAEIEEVVRAWFASMTPEDRAEHGSKFLGAVAAKLAFFCPRREVSGLLYALADQAATGLIPDRDPT